MDSGNSGSLQSSSGGDDEYESRAAASVDHHIFMATQPPPAPLFDPFSNYSQFLHHHPNPNDLNNANPSWTGSIPLRSDPNPNPTFLNPFMPSFQRPPPPPPTGSDPTTNPAGGGSATATRNPRKRSRASRRAPTTVLTTDTINFRAMVQEFTGIPAPPFNSPSLPRPNRLNNLFGSRSASPLEAAVPPYLRRPFDHRGPTPLFFHPSSTTNNTSSPASNINYQQLPFSNNNDLLLNINNNNNNNSQNQNQLFSSLLPSNPSKFIFSDMSAVSSKPTFDFQSDVKTGPGLVSSNRAAARNDREDNTDNENATKWRRNNSSEDNESTGYDQARIKPANGGFDFSGPTTSGFHGEKGPENIPTTRVGDQGMVESWIFSSD